MAGEADKFKGKIKQAAGDLTGNKDLRREGKVDHAAGTVKEKVDNATDKVKNKVEDIRR